MDERKKKKEIFINNNEKFQEILTKEIKIIVNIILKGALFKGTKQTKNKLEKKLGKEIKPGR